MPDVYGRIYRMTETRVSRQGTINRSSDIYERLARISELWATRYAETHREGDPPEPHSHLPRRSGLRTLGRLAEETEAKVLVAPHFYGAGVLGKYKERNPRSFTAVVLTDYVPHPVGVPPNLDLYVVADEAAAEAVKRLGVPEKHIHPTGIPIDPAFEEAADVPGVRQDLLKLPPKSEEDDLPIVIVMGGGLGGGHLESGAGFDPRSQRRYAPGSSLRLEHELLRTPAKHSQEAEALGHFPLLHRSGPRPHGNFDGPRNQAWWHELHRVSGFGSAPGSL
jgi:hypothetical protein